MSFSTVKSAAMEGLAVEMVYVEADVSNGLPIFHMVGYLSSEVKEAAERVRSAVRNSGLEFPAKRVVINLSPATMRKRGASFDLPIAVSILTSLGVLQQNRRMKDCMIIGELGLDGQVRKVPGILSMVSEAKVQKVTSCIVPRENEKEAELVEGVRGQGAWCLFFGYGRSGQMVSAVLMGILLSIYRHQNVTPELVVEKRAVAS